MEGETLHPHLAEIGFKQPTPRQRRDIDRLASGDHSFASAWAKVFTRDKFGAATTHWDKLIARLDQGVGSPCPVLAIGLPREIVIE